MRISESKVAYTGGAVMSESRVILRAWAEELEPVTLRSLVAKFLKRATPAHKNTTTCWISSSRPNPLSISP